MKKETKNEKYFNDLHVTKRIKKNREKVIKLQINIFMTVELFHVKYNKINIKWFSEETCFWGIFNWETISV